MKAQFICPIYPVRIFVVLEEKERIDSVRRSLNGYLGLTEFEIRHAVCFSCMPMQCCGLFFIPKASEECEAIAHECVHAANFIFASCNIGLNHQEDEAYAHLVGYLVKRVTGILESFKKRKAVTKSKPNKKPLKKKR